MNRRIEIVAIHVRGVAIAVGIRQGGRSSGVDHMACIAGLARVGSGIVTDTAFDTCVLSGGSVFPGRPRLSRNPLLTDGTYVSLFSATGE